MSNATHDTSTASTKSLVRLAAALAYEVITPGIGRCELTADAGTPERREDWPEDRGRCPGLIHALRWEDGFIDRVCERHAANAEERGAVVVRPVRADGTGVLLP